MRLKNRAIRHEPCEKQTAHLVELIGVLDDTRDGEDFT